ncbi:hypothetical protein QE152_g6998 [Popillia japonica]|uniref:Uncharacterized protein n=1 Tax=Popillia japonica TaxID=7064 RepID=A0AAW1MGL2_POPJA
MGFFDLGFGIGFMARSNIIPPAKGTNANIKKGTWLLANRNWAPPKGETARKVLKDFSWRIGGLGHIGKLVLTGPF